MRDYKARPGPKGRKPAPRHPLARNPRSREALPKGFPPLPRPPAARPPRPHRLAGALRAVAGWPWRGLAFGAALAWLLAGLAWGGVALWQAPLREVRLSGNAVVAPDDVLRLGGLSAGLPLHRLDPYATAQRIAAHPRLNAVDVRRLYPGRVAIRVRERQAELRVRLRDGRTALVDPDDVVLSLLPAGAALTPEQAALPLVGGLAGPAQPSRPLHEAGLARARALLAALRQEGLPEPERAVIDAGDPFLLTVQLAAGPRLIVPAAHAAAALRTYRTLAERYPSAFEAGRAVDLTPLDAAGGGRIVLRRH
jgi:cell division septal protein FtsQ